MSHDIGQFLTTLTNLLTNLTMKNLIGAITNYLITNHSVASLDGNQQRMCLFLFDAAKLLDFNDK